MCHSPVSGRVPFQSLLSPQTLTPDGHCRIRIFLKAPLAAHAGLANFVCSEQSVPFGKRKSSQEHHHHRTQRECDASSVAVPSEYLTRQGSVCFFTASQTTQVERSLSRFTPPESTAG